MGIHDVIQLELLEAVEKAFVGLGEGGTLPPDLSHRKVVAGDLGLDGSEVLAKSCDQTGGSGLVHYC